MKNLRFTMLIAALSLAACSAPIGPVLADCQGAQHAPLAVAGDDVHVIIFISHECPIANGYAPTLRELHASWASDARTKLFLVHVDPDFTAASAMAHAKDYELPGTLLMDPEQTLASECGATITPEAIVVTASGIAYRGRIDDQWRKLGSRAPQASQHDLADAVANVLKGQAVAQPFAKAVGCLLPEPRR
ncbi:MAG: hypothetical protein ACI89X_001239 [Planctomycetota bacterium]|jgi:hypothetical protein